LTAHAHRSLFARLGLAAALGGGLLGAAPAHAALVLFDDFSGGAISPFRWEGEEGKQSGTTRVEARRVVASGQLRIEAKGYSDNVGNTGTGSTRNSLIFVKSGSITDMRATVTPRIATVAACAANTSASVSRARLLGFFFNAGIPTPGSEYNDVFAAVQVYRSSTSTDPAGTLRIQGFVGICTDDNCIGSTTLGSADLGTVTLNTAVQLELLWDAAHNQFSFQRDSNAFVNVPYTVADTQPPSYNAKRIEVSNIVANCTATRNSTYSGADFDNIMTNALPANVVKGAAPEPAALAGSDEDPIFGHAN